MEELTTNELQQLLDMTSELKSKLVLKGSTNKDIAILDFYCETVLKELEKRNAVCSISIKEVKHGV